MHVLVRVALVASLSVGCGKGSQRNENIIDPTVLAPKLLHDEAELAQYLAAFPVGDYKIYQVPGEGKLYVDDAPDTIKDFLRKGIAWETHIDKLMRSHIRRGSTVLDIGAHIGTHTLPMARFAGPEGRVYAFEPQKKLYRELVRNIELNKITSIVPLRFAIGDKAGVIEMNPAAAGNEGGTGVGSGGDKAELRTVDSFGFKNISVLKIDVEGFEDNVLDGATATIAANRPVLIVEIQGGNDYETASPEVRAKIDATKQKMASLGYEVTKVSPHDYLGLPKRT